VAILDLSARNYKNNFPVKLGIDEVGAVEKGLFPFKRE
jgi:hypothetical protein